MNCDSFQDSVVEAARDVARGRALLTGIRAHIKNCSACSRRLEAELVLRRTMDELAETLEHVQAPPILEHDLLALYRQRQAMARARARRFPHLAGFPIAWAGATALLTIVAGSGVFYRWVSPQRSDRASVGKPLTLTQSTGEQEREDFMPLQPVANPASMEVVQVVRIQLARKAARDAGFSIEEGLDGDTIEAEVLVGSDGVARSIYLIR